MYNKRILLNNGNRKDLYLVCFEEKGEFRACFIESKSQQYVGTACIYKSILNVVKFAQKHHLKLYREN